MRSICMRRGFNNTFYFVERDITDSSDIVMELKITEKGNTFNWEKKVVYELSSGSVIALEIDPDND